MDEYISREAVVRYLKGYSEKECNSNSPYGMITSSVLNKAERALSEMPAADVQPVKHGRWVKDEKGTFHHCSECGGETFRDVDSWGLEYQEYCTDNCPNCGARMDGGVKND